MGFIEAPQVIDWRQTLTLAFTRTSNREPALFFHDRDRLANLDQAGGGGKIAIAVLHLLTPEGRLDHDKAAGQYRELSRWGDAGDLYFPVAGGSVEAFGTQVDTLGELLKQLEAAAANRPIEVPEDSKDSRADPVARKTALVGRAMQLAYPVFDYSGSLGSQ